MSQISVSQTKKLEKLTQEQESKLEFYQEKWLKIGLSTEPLDFENAKKCVKLVYQSAGLKEPKFYFRFQSPYACAIGQVIIKEILCGDQITEQVKDQVNEQIYGCHEANWLGFFEFFQKECDLVFIQKLQGLMDLAKYCGWWAPYTNVVFLQDRPCEIHFDAEKRTHADGKMAIKYRDGFGVYVWHGVTMPEKYGSIQSEAWKAKWILTEKNAELRRILIQGIGYGKICRDLNTKKIDSWREYELLRIDDADVEPIVMVKMICPSTGLIHVHRVSPDVTSAKEAITYVNQGIDPEEFVMEK